MEGGEPELLSGLRVNYDFFDTLGIRMEIGRAFLPEEDRPGRRHEVILSHGLWMRRFGGDPNILGRVIRLSDASFTVVGVLPASFRLAGDSGLAGDRRDFRAARLRTDRSVCLPRLPAPATDRADETGVPADRAHAELNTIMAGLVRAYPESYPAQAAVAFEPLQDYIVGRISTGFGC